MEPLSVTEREHFRQLFDRRLETVKAKTADVFAFAEVRQPPFSIVGAYYSLFGQDTDRVPDNYFADPAVMTNFQECIYYDQVREIEDDFVPYLVPWFGTAVVASALGCQVEFYPKQDPASNPRFYPIATPDDVRKLQLPDPERDGLMPRVLTFQRYMKRSSFLPVGITDLQGPLTTANQLMGYDKLIYLMTDYPTAAHELMEKVTEALIHWVKVQKKVIGEALTECIADQLVYTGAHIGVWFADDDAVIMSPKYYREFVVPYNSRLLREFGGGCLHFCGKAAHQAENFLATAGLRAVNVYTLHDIRAFRELRSKLQGRIVMFACDYTPLHYEEYFRDLLDDLSSSGLVINSLYSPVVALLPGGKYVAARRDIRSGRRAVHAYVRQRLRV